MSIMTAALRDRLLAAPEMTALVGDRVFRDDWPEGVPAPVVLIFLISDPRPSSFEGPMLRRWSRVQVDCVATSPGEAGDIAERMIELLAEGETIGGVQFDPAFVLNGRTRGNREQRGVGTKNFVASTDLQVWWRAL